MSRSRPTPSRRRSSAPTPPPARESSSSNTGETSAEALPVSARPVRRWTIALCTGLALLALGGSLIFADWWSCLPDDVRPTYVGRQSCVQCHAREAKLFENSHHDLAMDRATPETVLGDFDDATITHHGITSRMFRREDRFFVHTEGPDGRMTDFEVKYVLGVDPLQNYMVEFDRDTDQPTEALPRLQVLRITWDTRGKKWFHLDPPDVKDKLAPDDVLHWTGLAQRWNNMCADCHSTNLQKNFDVDSGKYHTTFSEIDVSCEACHGPGSLHVQLANSRSLFWDRKRGYGLARLKTDSNEAEIQACAPCHSRRRVVSTAVLPGDQFFDGYVNELLGPLTYHADGQILDEVYEFGSFLQSKMYHKNIRCSNCHDVHSTRVKHQGNQLCTSCHAHPAGKYDGPAHHHHEPGGTGAQCVNCHMPVTTYMDVDPRRDHSLRVPRPGLSVALGTPNACTGCHLERDRSLDKVPADIRPRLSQYADWIREAPRVPEIRAELARLDTWSHEAARRWWGEKADDPKHYAYTLHAARSGQTDAESRLIALARDGQRPAIVRATAFEVLGESTSTESMTAAERGVLDADPQVRIAALQRFDQQISSLNSGLSSGESRDALTRHYGQVVRAIKPLLNDPRRAVRLETARRLARIPGPILSDLLYGQERDAVDRLLGEYLEGLTHDDDRAAAHLSRAALYEDLGEEKLAEAAYRRAIRVEPGLTGSRGNLAALLERRTSVLEQQLAAGDVALRGPLEELRAEIRRWRRDELPLLARDAGQLPNNAALQYRYAMGLYLNDEVERAEQVLLKAAQLEPENDNVLLGLTLLYEKLKRPDEARRWADRLRSLRPNNPAYHDLGR